MPVDPAALRRKAKFHFRYQPRINLFVQVWDEKCYNEHQRQRKAKFWNWKQIATLTDKHLKIKYDRRKEKQSRKYFASATGRCPASRSWSHDRGRLLIRWQQKISEHWCLQNRDLQIRLPMQYSQPRIRVSFLNPWGRAISSEWIAREQFL